METRWLAIPYTIIALLEGGILYLLSALPLQMTAVSQRLHRFKTLNIKWYKWYLRYLKDLLIIGALIALTSRWLSDLLPWLNLAIFSATAMLLLAKSLSLLGLWLICAGYSLPGWLCSLVAAVSVPPLVPASGWRVAGWGVLFILTAGAAFAAWFAAGGPQLLIAGFFLLTLGFVSVCGALFPEKRREDCSDTKDIG